VRSGGYFALLLLVIGAKPEMCTKSMMHNIPRIYEQFLENLLEINPDSREGVLKCLQTGKH
jgi:hypothetical protein